MTYDDIKEILNIKDAINDKTEINDYLEMRSLEYFSFLLDLEEMYGVIFSDNFQPDTFKELIEGLNERLSEKKRTDQ